MRENIPSRTAYATALTRAAHQILDTPPVFEDPLAFKILPRQARAALGHNPRRFERRLFGDARRAYLTVRSRLAEDTLAVAVAAGIRQYVVLGAGLDTFGLRNANPGLRVFEVDFPATQTWKRERIAESGVTPPTTLSFVPVDFARQQLGDQLLAAGFDPERGAFYSWLGVVPYLEASVVWNTLGHIAKTAGPNGGVVFDYGADVKRAPIERLMLWLLARRVARLGEPIRSVMPPADLVRGMRELGFGTVAALDRVQLNPRYFHARRDGLRLRGGHFIVATM